MANATAKNHLKWVSSELNELLGSARRGVEEFVEGSGDPTILDKSASRFSQAGGTLEMLQVYGAAMMARELETLSRKLEHRELDIRDQVAEALLVGVLRLSDYLEKLEGGQPDFPILVLPYLNELRDARQAPPLTESDLFSPNLETGIPEDRGNALTGSANEDLRELAHSLRHGFQLGLLGLHKNPDSNDNLEKIQTILAQLGAVAGMATTYRLFWVAGALVDALQAGTPEAGVAMKVLLGKLDREIKRIAEEGESVIAEQPPTDLLRAMLYHVARSGHDGERVAEVKEAFTLDDALPSEEQIQRQREQLGSPYRDMLDAVSSALQEDLGTAKNDLDLFIQNDRQESGSLDSVAATLRRCADTLDMVSAEDLGQTVRGQADRVQAMVDDKGPRDDIAVAAVAETLLAVEDSLSQLTAGNDVPGQEQAAAGRNAGAATLDEVAVEIGKLKDAIGAFIGTPGNRTLLDPVPDCFERIVGGLRVLSLDRCAELSTELANFVAKELIDKHQTPKHYYLDLLADAITGIDCFVEAEREERPGRNEFLDITQESLSVIRHDTEVAAATSESDSELDFHEEKTTRDEVVDDVPVEAAPNTGNALELQDQSTEGPELDAEIIGIFLDEAREELDAIGHGYQRWRDDTDDMETLAEMRRSFHTLKGSGRVAGATEISRLSEAMERLLNQVLNKTAPVTDAVVEYVDEVVETMPSLVVCQAEGRAPETDLNALCDRGNQLASNPAESHVDEPKPDEGEDETVDHMLAEVEALQTSQLDEPIAGELQVEPAPTDAAATGSENESPEAGSSQSFETEVCALLTRISEFVQAGRNNESPTFINESLNHVVRQLQSSAEAAGFADVSDVAEAMTDLVNLFVPDKREFSPDCFGLLDECVSVVALMVAHHQQETNQQPDHGELLDKIHAFSVSFAAEDAVDMQSDAPNEDADEPVPVSIDAEQTDTPNDEEPDEELRAVFVEEAGELLEELDRSLQCWADDPEQTGPVTVVQGTLHTLKGSARLAGVSEIGDLSHGLESLLTEFSSGRLPGSATLASLAQAACDQLVSLLEQLIQQGHCEPATGLIAQMEAFRQGSPSVEQDTHQGVAASESEEPVEPQSHAEAPGADGSVAHPAEKVENNGAVEEAENTEPGSEATEPDSTDFQPKPRLILVASQSTDEPEQPAELETPPARVVSKGRGETKSGRRSHEQIRLQAEQLDQLINRAGEISIYRSRLEQQNTSLHTHVAEMAQIVERLQQQLREMEIETEAQIRHRFDREPEQHAQDFDPLEMDRFSKIQQLSRSLLESASDLGSIEHLFQDLCRETDTLLVQQSRVSTDLQEALLRSRMVSFSKIVPRLSRIVRQTSEQLDKQAALQVVGSEGDMDRSILDRLVAPLEHMLRNSLCHGIEAPEDRINNNKPEQGAITIELQRDGNEVVLHISDDGAGIDLDRVRAQAVERNLISAGSEVTDEEALQFILDSGFSTADEVTQISGRGVGMDVVNREIKQMGGSLRIQSEPGVGTLFTIRLPFTLAIIQTLLVELGDEVYAIPHSSIDAVVRVSTEALNRYHSETDAGYEFSGENYRIQYLGNLLGTGDIQLSEQRKWYPVLLVRSGENRIALQVDGLMGSHETVVKSVGPQLASVRWISGGSVLGDGRVVLILDSGALVRMAAVHPAPAVQKPVNEVPASKPDQLTALVVDDSITVRKVTERLLTRHNMRVLTAKDGVDAFDQLQEQTPDIILLDIEMPRMDGFELASHIRNDERLKEIPIVMITSRSGDKHRNRASGIGVNRYLGKPYQEDELLEAIQQLTSTAAE